MRAGYDFSGGVRGKYVDRYRRGVDVVLIGPELAEAFPDSTSVNDALRALAAIAARTENRQAHVIVSEKWSQSGGTAELSDEEARGVVERIGACSTSTRQRSRVTFRGASGGVQSWG